MKNKICLQCGREYEKDKQICLKQWNKSKYCSRKCCDLFKIGKSNSRRLNLDEKKVMDMYNKRESIYQIAQTMKCSISPILRVLKENRIKIRKHKISPENREKMNLARIGSKLSEEHKLNIKKSLIGRLPHNKGKTKENYEPLKRMSEGLKGRYTMNKNPNWQGGLSFEPYDKHFNNIFKRAIRRRDNQICMLCGIHKEKLNRALDVHHINYDKKMSIPQNCISLCKKCHMKTNFDRGIWTKHFQLLLSKKYDYQYSENKEIILKLNEK